MVLLKHALGRFQFVLVILSRSDSNNLQKFGNANKLIQANQSYFITSDFALLSLRLCVNNLLSW